MKYLDKVLKETLRKYPIMAMLTREAQENYTFKGTKVTIEKGIKDKGGMRTFLKVYIYVLLLIINDR